MTFTGMTTDNVRSQSDSITRQVVAVILIGVMLTGCTSTERTTMTQGCWNGLQGDPAYVPTALEDLVSACSLTPTDTYMIDLNRFIFDVDATHKPADTVRQMLRNYRQEHGDTFYFLMMNPVSGEQISDYSTLRHVLVSLIPIDTSAKLPNEILVDFTTNTIWWSEHDLLSYSGSVLGKKMELSATGQAAISGLMQDTASWTAMVGSKVPSGWQSSSYGTWTVALCAADDSVHRFQGFDSRAPGGFNDFVSTFLATLDLSQLG